MTRSEVHPATPGLPMAPGGRAAVLAAAGIGVLAGMGSAAWVTLKMQANLATRVIEMAALEMAVAQHQLPTGVIDPAYLEPPNGDGVYLPSGTHRSASSVDGLLTLAMLGDSTSAGYGTRTADEVPGVMLARQIAARRQRPVRLVTHGLSGSGAADLPRQLAAVLPDAPDVVVICTGGNDVRDTIPVQRSAAQLGDAVAALRAQGIAVVAGTCPDFGVIVPIPQPLRTVVGRWSRRLATLQERAVTAAGGRSVAIGRLVSPAFIGRPDLFSSDRFHPSGAGYARAVAVLLPAILDALAEAAGAPPNKTDGEITA